MGVNESVVRQGYQQVELASADSNEKYIASGDLAIYRAKSALPRDDRQVRQRVTAHRVGFGEARVATDPAKRFRKDSDAVKTCGGIAAMQTKWCADQPARGLGQTFGPTHPGVG